MTTQPNGPAELRRLAGLIGEFTEYGVAQAEAQAEALAMQWEADLVSREAWMKSEAAMLSRAERAEAALERARALASQMQKYADGMDLAELNASGALIVATIRAFGDKLAAALREGGRP